MRANILCIFRSSSTQAGHDNIIDFENTTAKRRYERVIGRPAHLHVEKGVKKWGIFLEHLRDYEELLFSTKPSPGSLVKRLKKMRTRGGLDEKSSLFELVGNIQHFYENMALFVEERSRAKTREPHPAVEKEFTEDFQGQTNESNQETEEKQPLLGETKEGNIQEWMKFEQRNFNGDKESARYFRKYVRYFNHLKNEWESKSTVMECLKNEEYYIIVWAAAIINTTAFEGLNDSGEFLHRFFEDRGYDPALYLLAYLSSNDLRHFSLAKTVGERQFFTSSHLEIESLNRKQEAACRRIKVFLYSGACCFTSTLMGLIFLVLYIQLPEHFRQ
ncbi:MAG: hypothetical protein BGO67_01870 [Alphaproteobacteria bacterium 41-28]|nr:MAG: hypothetical protein BGO67_01870 [Alphaproteobacteria bacterium 41-28]